MYLLFEGSDLFQLLRQFILLLTQSEEWVEKDGIYVVKVNLATGEIEDILYDSALAGNG